MGYNAVLFDWDGVLLEVNATNRRFKEEVRQVLAGFGIKNPPNEHVEALASLEDAARQLEICDNYGIDIHEFWRRRERQSYQYQRDVIREGKRQLYTDINAIEPLYRSVDMGIVSNNLRSIIDFVVTRKDINYLFETIHAHSGEWNDRLQLKPQPHFLHKAMNDLGTSDVLYIGDSKADIQAAAAAGIDAAFIQRPHRDNYHLPTDPTYQLSSLHDLPGVIE